MTTGTITRGTESDVYNSPFYYTRTWNGTDGKYSDPLTKKHVKWNNYAMDARSGTQTPGVDPNTWQNRQYMGYLWGPQNLIWDTTDTLAAQSKIASACRGHTFNLGVALAEGHETMALVVGTITRFTSAIKQLKRGRFDLALRSLGAVPRGRHKSSRVLGPRGKYLEPPRPRRLVLDRHGNARLIGVDPVIQQKRIDRALLRQKERVNLDPKELTHSDIGSMWLEIQYGWRPLLSDVYESQTAYAKLMDPPRTSRVEASHSIKATYSSENYYAKWTVASVMTQRIICIYVEDNSITRSLGLENPLSVAWEVVPFSFVVDWFIPIGSYLDTVSSMPKLNANFLTMQRTVAITTGKGKAAPYLNASSNGKRTIFTRTGSSSLNVPFPGFKPLPEALSSGHIKNALALLQQVISH